MTATAPIATNLHRTLTDAYASVNEIGKAKREGLLSLKSLVQIESRALTNFRML